MTSSSSGDMPTCKPLPKHKLAVLTFIGLLIPGNVIPKYLIALFPDRPLLVTVLAVGAIVLLMTYAIMPVLIWLFRGWLRPSRTRTSRS